MKKKILFNYQFASKVMAIYAVTVLIISIIAKICGDEVYMYSSLYQLGSKGLAYETLMQLLASSIVLTMISSFFVSEKYLKNWMMLWRIVGMMLSILVVMIGFIYFFKWLPFDPSTASILAWGSFLIAFLGCFGGATLLSVIKIKLEEKKYDGLLQDYKNKQRGMEENE